MRFLHTLKVLFALPVLARRGRYQATWMGRFGLCLIVTLCSRDGIAALIVFNSEMDFLAAAPIVVTETFEAFDPAISPNRKIFEARKRETAALGAGEKLVLGHPLAATIGDSARCMQNLEKVLFTGPKTSDTVTFICD